MGLGILGIGISGLNAAQIGIRTTGQNISNANTAGYHRQDATYAAQTAVYSPAGWLGNGVATETVRRQYDQFLEGEVMLDQTQLSRHEVYATQSARLDTLLGDENSGLSGVLTSFFNSASEVANDPTSAAARQVMLASGRNLSARVNSLYSGLQQMMDDSNKAIESISTRINTHASHIASLNLSIAHLEGVNGQPANDLRDQRDQTIAELNKLANVSVLEQSDGSFSVFIGTGQLLVAGSTANQLDTPVVDSNDSYNSNPAPKQPTLNGMTLTASQVTGGEMGGWLSFRDELVKSGLSNLNRIAVAVGAEVNRVHTSGSYYDSASGAMKAGGDFFSGVVSRTAGTGSISVNLSTSRLANEDYSVAYNAGNYTVTRSSDSASVTVAAGVEVSLGGVAQGFSIAVGSPAPLAGDTWDLNFQDYAHSMSAQLSNIEQVAAAAQTALSTAADADNTGAATIGAATVVNRATYSMTAQVTLTYDNAGTQYVVTGATPAVANIAYTGPGAQTISLNGVSFSITGAPADGDVFTLTNASGTGDNSNILNLTRLPTLGFLDNGATTFSATYNQLVSYGASRAAEASVNQQAFSTLASQAQSAQQSVSGVNLDEEAVNLMRYQQAYQASAKAIAVANTLFDSILAIAR